MDPTAEELAETLAVLVDVFNEKQTAYALIGGIAASIRGQIRPTRDVDFLLRIPQLELPGLLETLKQRGCNLDTMQTIERWNRDHLVSFDRKTIRIDWLKPVLPLFEHVLSRARWEQINDRQIRVADAEGLLLLKLIAFRARDQEDIKGILAANPGRLDLDWVRSEWRQLADKDDPKTTAFEELVREFYESTDGGAALKS